MRKNAEGSKVLEKGRERIETRDHAQNARYWEGLRVWVQFWLCASGNTQEKSICSLDVEDTSQQVLVCWKRALHARALLRTSFSSPRRTCDKSIFAKIVWGEWKERKGSWGREVINKVKAMCNEIIKWHDAYPIESFRLKYMAVHPVQLPPSTCATSVDASFRKWNNINVTNDEKHHQLWLINDDSPRWFEQRWNFITMQLLTQTSN